MGQDRLDAQLEPHSGQHRTPSEEGEHQSLEPEEVESEFWSLCNQPYARVVDRRCITVIELSRLKHRYIHALQKFRAAHPSTKTIHHHLKSRLAIHQADTSAEHRDHRSTGPHDIDTVVSALYNLRAFQRELGVPLGESRDRKSSDTTTHTWQFLQNLSQAIRSLA